MECYLPENENGWYDLRDGEHYSGGRFIRTAVNMDAIPVFVRAGSIVPMGEEVQYAAQSIEELSTYMSIREPMVLSPYTRTPEPTIHTKTANTAPSN